MSPLVSRVVRSTVAFRPLPAAQRSLRTSSILRDTEPYQSKPPQQSRDHNKLLGAGAVLIGATFFWFYRGGKPAAFDASGESTGMKSATK
ncbi:hypothetical protein SNK03_011296 [Fusarium graminearum]|uniref:Chromosome 3, complete genome n=4 Tax=Fusarium sambucinum species complex TaxID=569360 RepID=I1RMZ2_GIBZE|nr:hypothetical protein FPSE_09261 [Fusarium pseudograminearum CS3096]XP_011323868.1 hypothetical protein FGSG_05348 [Fusarium graminearum PH-1]EYB30091.1 hypothetical protein FG05_05348 [Fusarium graminearum]KAF0644087.1 hypothetical protein FPSE5266_09261 [Fusarium pseudograminearum]KAF5242708.1 hypothetical protein FAUST_3173 [Fusarium austroamericanum]EKJ70508.1 hypothetical protein FPSE_09261 [Fusarium pseudograminearum CS3096]ESU11292.1 hypothetical protein FGSG_05348 [Fusarium graminea|eukprot:XP_011323868.1 hypothetical protein FGSG_05348 [Fusarium graminearum PH-1]